MNNPAICYTCSEPETEMASKVVEECHKCGEGYCSICKEHELVTVYIFGDKQKVCRSCKK